MKGQLGILTIALSLISIAAIGSRVERRTDGVYIYPDKGQARVVCLQVVGERILRVRATSDRKLPQKPKSLMVVEQPGGAEYTVGEDRHTLTVKTKRMQAVVDKQTGAIEFRDAKGKRLLSEAREGKRFWPYEVPSREIGVDSGRVSPQQRQGLSWQMVFDSPADEAFYGLGQHQSEELNMKGRNEELYQYNTKVSVPFVVSNKRYGLLWDSYSYCRFGQPFDYEQLHRVFRLYDRDGRAGQLTGTYSRPGTEPLVRGEDSIYFEYDLPQRQQVHDRGGIKNLPQGFSLDGARVVFEGYLEPLAVSAENNRAQATAEDFQFILYYAGYVKVFLGDSLVVPERWRTAWNPNSYKFTARVPRGQSTPLRIEWQPDGGISYCGLRVARPRSKQEQGQLSVWSEMAQDLDYYFIGGETLDDVIGGYRTLTGRAPVYPKWALGYWQSRERYKTQAEVEQTLSEFRRRHIPIDNIVQDWNYWPEDQWGSHSFEAARYPNPQAMVDSIHRLHGRLMISVWPKFYVNTDHYKAFDRQGWMYHQAVSDDIHDWVGRGYVGSFYDAYSPGARQLFWQQMDKQLYSGLQPSEHARIDAWWMDASEPNVRDCTPMWYRKALCGPTALGTATEYFNAYALVNAQAIYEGQRSATSPTNQPRVFLLTRSGFAGLQRYGTATWSGDIGTRWEDMRAQMTAGMNYALSGLPFWGMDIGGFCVERRYVKASKNKELEESDDLREWRELQTRWHQFGAFTPLFRAHGQWPLREPWNIAPEDHPAYRSFLYYDRLRYRLMPYLYSMAGWVHLRHYTMMRALVMDFPDDPQACNVKDQWLFGPSLMVCPVSTYGARSRNVYFPKERVWYDASSGQVADGRQPVAAPLDRIPLFVPEGSIIPLGPAMEWSDEKAPELIDLYVYAGRDAHFTLYEDEGTNYNYEQGQYATIDISYHEATRTLTFGARKGSFPGVLSKRRFNIVYVTKEAPKPLDDEHPEGQMLTYDGLEAIVKL